MAYSRLPLVCRDFILGKESVNQAIDNLAWIRDTFAVNHGLSSFHHSDLPGALDTNGHHDDDRLSRIVGVHYFSDSFIDGRPRPAGSVYADQGISSWLQGAPSGFITRWKRITVGTYEMALVCSKPSLSWVECCAEDASADSPRLVIGRVRPSALPRAADPYLHVGYWGAFYCYEHVGSSGWRLRDMDFSVAYFNGA